MIRGGFLTSFYKESDMVFVAIGDGFFSFMIVMAIGFWSMARMFKKFDSNGAVKDVARKGAVNLIGKWLK